MQNELLPGQDGLEYQAGKSPKMRTDGKEATDGLSTYGHSAETDSTQALLNSTRQAPSYSRMLTVAQTQEQSLLICAWDAAGGRAWLLCRNRLENCRQGARRSDPLQGRSKFDLGTQNFLSSVDTSGILTSKALGDNVQRLRKSVSVAEDERIHFYQL